MLADQKILIQTIKQIKSTNQLKHYLDFIQFPYYRNLELNARINFHFPLTIFIGQNGCGKSSALHALYGSVKGKTPGNFWFDTKVDPIQYYNDEKKRHSFWYSYKDQKNIEKQVVKARIKRIDNPNYWETSRPLTWAGMYKGKRNQPIKKNVVYLDFRGELSAFDKFFYFGDLKNTKSKNKQEFIRRRSASLKKVLDGEKEFIRSASRTLNEKPEVLPDEELKYISYILGRDYTFCQSVKHSIFRNEGYSILFQTSFAKYSEAFAGSGEAAVVRLVREILAAEENSLILLDEPEVSLHPGAQKRLKLFLLDQIKLKKHQIIITSHSPILIQGLPKEAIKVFQQNPSNGRFSVLEDLIPEEAFYHIEFPIGSKKNLIVEDKLAKEIISAVLQEMGSARENLFYLRHFPGGESVLKKEFMTVYCRERNSNEFIIFDGDQKRVDEHFDWQSLRVDEISINTLKKMVKTQTNEDIIFSVDGNVSGGDQKQQLELLKSYLDYYKANVFYLPQKTPEEIIWNDAKADLLLSIKTQKAEEKEKLLERINKEQSIKKRFALLAKEVTNDDSSEGIFHLQKIFIQAWAENANDDYKQIKSILDHITKA